jgi:hypothetical protein
MSTRPEDPEVRWTGRGRVTQDTLEADVSLVAACGACAVSTGPVVVFGGVGVCADCMRQGLNALSVARWRFDHEAGKKGLPWGKISG